MDTLPDMNRQSTAARTRRRVSAGCCLLLLSLAGLARAEPPSAAPPPPWARELQALRQRPEHGPKPTPGALATAWRELAARYPAEPAVQRACGDFLSGEAGQPDEALPYWQRAQSLAPGDAETADLLANAHLRRGEWRPATEQFRRAITAQPGAGQFHVALGNVLLLFRRELTDPVHPTPEHVLRAAQEEFRLAARLAPENVEYAQAYADVFYLLANPDWETAAAAWRTVLELSGPAKPDYALSHLVRVSLRQRRPAPAREYLGRMRDPEFASVKAKLLRQVEALESGTATRR